jgi:hypothetical protein
MTWVLNTSFQVRIHLPRTVLWKGRTKLCVTWLGRCLMSIGLRERLLTVNFRQPSHEFTFSVGIDLLF